VDRAPESPHAIAVCTRFLLRHPSSRWLPESCWPPCRIYLQVHDTYFVVGAFALVLIGGAVFSLFGSFIFLFPKITRPHDGEPWALNFGFVLHTIGFHVAFYPDASPWLAWHAAPRGFHTYPSEWDGEREFARTIGRVVIVATCASFVITWSKSFCVAGSPAVANPFGAATLEWAFCPPPPFILLPLVPVITDRDHYGNQRHSPLGTKGPLPRLRRPSL